jgi:chemotaxis protein methyltransferase CheR
MSFNAETLGLPSGIDMLLRDLIQERTGMFYDKRNCELLTDKLSPLVIERGFTSFLDYYYLLKYDPEANEEWRRVINALSVQETYFWREIDQVRSLVDVLVPKLRSTNCASPLRIWSAACATGEEPLTIAMALNEAGWFERAPIEIHASDASTKAIEKAREGVYRERSFRNLSPNLREKYFTQEQGHWRVAPELLRRINWTVANLMAESDVRPLAAGATVIFCRNVFIYFSPETIGKTVNLFSKYMSAQGYLFVASSESLLRLATDFKLREIGGAFVYVKD